MKKAKVLTWILIIAFATAVAVYAAPHVDRIYNSIHQDVYERMSP